MQRFSVSICLALILCCWTTWVSQTRAQSTDLNQYNDSFESTDDVAPAASEGYRKQWALIVGIDYADGEAFNNAQRREIPQLSNARRDAEALKEKLIQKYGYGSENVVLLLETEATQDRIIRELQRLNSPDVGDQDSVLVFFAGHGAKQDDGDGNVVIYPHDVELRNGRATSGMISVRNDLIAKLDNSAALHKLLILDSCYSGEVFSQKLDLQAPSDPNNGNDQSLFSQRGFQVIASCRGYQEASDGNGVHSPFALALLRGLEEIPSNEKEPPRIWTGRLMKTLDEEFRGMESSQRPSHRSLAGGQGEFTFFPDFENAEFGDQSHGQLLSVAMLRATSPGVKGNWWFEEMPWFMPSIRGRILMQNQVQSRSNDLSASIRPSSLRRVAGKVRQKMLRDIKRLEANADTNASKEPELLELRRLSLRADHLTRLLKQTDPAARLKTLESVEADLLAPENEALLEASDLHLLAVVQHAIGRQEAITTYESAIVRYAVPRRDAENDSRLSMALKALCHADFGDCLAKLGSEPTDSIEQFNQALGAFRQNPPPAFRVYCLCRLASAYLSDNRWDDAKFCLETAKEAVEDFDSKSYLAAFVHKSDAWSKMIQWDVAQAVEAFQQSNEVLLPLIVENASPEARKAEQVESLGERSEAFEQSSDFGAKVAYFHNLHGFAMAMRYRGDPMLAAHHYRQVIAMIEDALFRLRSASDESSTRTETEMSLLGRFVNSQERLGDCNLLSAPEQRDLAEAADDYRRALSRVHRLPTTSRTNLRAQLLYKQSLAFALPSPVQDCDLALEMCHHADQLLEADNRRSSGLLLALRTLTTPTVEMLANAANVQSIAPTGKAEPNVTEAMRSAIQQLRDIAGPSAHRDQLELMLFATRNLIEYGKEPSRLKRSEDVELLLSLNRLALTRRSNSSVGLGSQSFLRQYYNTAFLASMKTTPSDTKRMLEIQHEATSGSRYGKSHLGLVSGQPKHSGPQPVLAIYQVGQAAYLICDCPRSQGICISLDDICTPDELTQICNDNEQLRMRLPTKIAKQLDTFYSQPQNTMCACSLHFRDPVNLLGYRELVETSLQIDKSGNPNRDDPKGVTLKLIGDFPFKIEAHWHGATAVPTSAKK
ncbi:caspase family protein [Rhodopirellula sp. SWK7]|uniref:caspase family protein n=1 Tax=Rhodopirellula sp. SWK7 TaxID=595460 RepID=UPI0002BFBECA|nr:caspase family protein [Rhodopirellula sp. SWK7]EMI44938.1 secreted protein containing Peptidase C14, caspase catalytic domain protein [Rhodopirellula sp. SWK7]